MVRHDRMGIDRSTHPVLRRLAAALACAAFLGACRVLGYADATVSFFSEPPGARVVIDRQDSGFVTPCRITLASRDDHRVELELPGYATARLELTPSLDHDVVLWKDMALAGGTWHFPLWLNFDDTVRPVKFAANLKPGRVFVRLQRSAPR